ncbi:hypothetical protein RINTHM_2330 [Richelia intracellularis HM01]|nr:hypothetical protein RINTHM_2330 [Richelia intracellularis HM01]
MSNNVPTVQPAKIKLKVNIPTLKISLPMGVIFLYEWCYQLC